MWQIGFSTYVHECNSTCISVTAYLKTFKDVLHRSPCLSIHVQQSVMDITRKTWDSLLCLLHDRNTINRVLQFSTTRWVEFILYPKVVLTRAPWEYLCRTSLKNWRFVWRVKEEEKKKDNQYKLKKALPFTIGLIPIFCTWPLMWEMTNTAQNVYTNY